MLFRQAMNKTLLKHLKHLSRTKSNYSTNSSSSLVKTDLLQGDDDKGLLIVSLCRHDGKNSLNKSMVDRLEGIFDAVKEDEAVRTVIIKSEVPKVFCAGADLKERSTMGEKEVRSFVNKLRGLMKKLEDVPVPVIAAINGVAFGGGLEMALACDIRVASDTSKMGLVETRLAIIPGAGGTQRLARIIGPAIAKELIFTSRVFNGKEAAAYGIVNHCVATSANDGAFDKALQIAREILPNGPLAVKMAKIAVNEGINVDMDTGASIEELCYSRIVPTKDRMEGLKAFQEKRPAFYTGE